jgi:hypothetical protein
MYNKDMKQFQYKPLLVLVIVFLALAGITNAYDAPSATPTGDNTPGPLDISAENQLKDSGLSVNTFVARGNALFSQKAVFNGLIRGGSPTDVNSVINFGGTSGATTHSVEVQATGTVKATGILNATNLVHSNTDDQQICSDVDGNIILCQYGPYVTGTSTIYAINGYGYSGNGASAPDTVLCNVRLTVASANNETFDLKYTYDYLTGVTTAGCLVTVPAGSTYGEIEVNPVNPPHRVTSICAQSGTMTIPSQFQC